MRRVVRFVAPAFALALLATAPAVRAQCASNASSCTSCHEGQAAKSVINDGTPWHRDHGFGDLCASCHGGDAASAEKAQAHRGMVAPLMDAKATCGRCHDDGSARAERYAAAAKPPPPPAGPSSSGRVNGVLVDVAALLAFAIAFVVRQRRPRVADWRPYLAGAGLGVVASIALAMFGRPLAASGAFERGASAIGRATHVGSDTWRAIGETRPAFGGSAMRGGMGWPVWLVIGIFLGALAAALLTRQFAVRTIPEEGWTEAFGPSRAKRFLVAFLGAALVQLGAGIAGGCTSGLAISGGIVLAPAAFLFVAGMFAGGIPVALFLFGRGGRHE